MNILMAIFNHSSALLAQDYFKNNQTSMIVQSLKTRYTAQEMKKIDKNHWQKREVKNKIRD